MKAGNLESGICVGLRRLGMGSTHALAGIIECDGAAAVVRRLLERSAGGICARSSPGDTEAITKVFTGKAKDHVRTSLEQHNTRARLRETPAQKGATFEVPQLSIRFGERVLPIENDLLVDEGFWNPVDTASPLDTPSFDTRTQTWEIDERRTTKAAASTSRLRTRSRHQSKIDHVASHWGRCRGRALTSVAALLIRPVNSRN